MYVCLMAWRELTNLNCHQSTCHLQGVSYQAFSSVIAVVIPGMSGHGRHIPLKQHLHPQKQHAQQSVYRPCCHRFHKGVEYGKDARCIHWTRRTKMVCLAEMLVSIPPLLKLHSSLSVFSHHTLSALFGHDFNIQDLSCHSWQCCDNPICCRVSSFPPCSISRYCNIVNDIIFCLIKFFRLLTAFSILCFASLSAAIQTTATWSWYEFSFIGARIFIAPAKFARLWCLIPRFLMARTILWLTSKVWLPSTLLDV